MIFDLKIAWSTVNYTEKLKSGLLWNTRRLAARRAFEDCRERVSLRLVD
jgi:hypothetical protein